MGEFSKEKDQFIQVCCDFYDEHSESDKQWFTRNYDQCDEPHEKNNICMHKWQFPLFVLRSQQSKIEQLEKKLNNCENLLAEWKSQGMKGCSDYARGGLHTRQDCEDALEKTLRGECE